VAIEAHIARLDQQLEVFGATFTGLQRLMSVPGVGPFVALVFIAAIEDVGRCSGCGTSEPI